MSPDERKAIAIEISHMLPEQEFTYFCFVLANLSESAQTNLLIALDNLMNDKNDGFYIKHVPDKDGPILNEVIEILDGWVLYTNPVEITPDTKIYHVCKL